MGKLFFRRVSELGCRTVLKIQRRGSFEDKSWRDVGGMVQSILLGLHELGLAKGNNVAILGGQQFVLAVRRPGDIDWSLAKRGDLAQRFGPYFVKDPQAFSLPRHLYRCRCRTKAARY